MASNRSPFRRLISHLMAVAIAMGPFAVSLHAVHHVPRSSATCYSTHDEHAHHAHTSPDQHHLCALCVHAKAPFVSAPGAPQAFAVVAQDDAPVARDHGAPLRAWSSGAAPRAPPIG